MNSRYKNQLYIFDVDRLNWSLVEIKGDVPIPRSHFGIAIVNHKLILFGGIGIGSTRYADSWVFNNVSTGIKDDSKEKILLNVFPNPFLTQFFSISKMVFNPSINTSLGTSGIAIRTADLLNRIKFSSGRNNQTASFSSL